MLIAMVLEIASESQPLNFVPMMPDICLVPAPPPPAGPMGVPVPFPITTTTSNVVDSPAEGVQHAGKKVMNTDSVVDGIQGNQAGVGRLPPGKPEKDILTGTIMGKACAVIGCPTVKVGGKPVVFVSSMGLGNQS